MLVFAAVGLDSLVKHLIRDALRALTAKDRAVQEELETFVLRQLRRDLSSGESDARSGRKFLSRVLVAPNALSGVTEQYIKDLTGESMQSAEQQFRAVKALGVEPAALGLDGARQKEVFGTRNEIIHEMDIDLTSRVKQARKRRSRTIDDMTAAVEYLLTVGLIEAVEAKLVRVA